MDKWIRHVSRSPVASPQHERRLSGLYALCVAGGPRQRGPGPGGAGRHGLHGRPGPHALRVDAGGRRACLRRRGVAPGQAWPTGGRASPLAARRCGSRPGRPLSTVRDRCRARPGACGDADGPATRPEHWITAALAFAPGVHPLLPQGGVATGSMDKRIRVFDTQCTCVQTLSGHSGGVISLALTPNHRLLSGSWDGTAREWDLNSGTELTVMPGHENGVAVHALADGTIVTGACAWPAPAAAPSPTTSAAPRLDRHAARGRHYRVPDPHVARRRDAAANSRPRGCVGPAAAALGVAQADAGPRSRNPRVRCLRHRLCVGGQRRQRAPARPGRRHRADAAGESAPTGVPMSHMSSRPCCSPPPRTRAAPRSCCLW